MGDDVVSGDRISVEMADINDPEVAHLRATADSLLRVLAQGLGESPEAWRGAHFALVATTNLGQAAMQHGLEGDTTSLVQHLTAAINIITLMTITLDQRLGEVTP